MTKYEILQQQVDALEELLRLKQATIDELKDKIERLEADKYHRQPVVSPITFPGPTIVPFCQELCSDGRPHDYPNPCTVTNPSCLKCGKPLVNFPITTCSNTFELTTASTDDCTDMPTIDSEDDTNTNK